MKCKNLLVILFAGVLCSSSCDEKFTEADQAKAEKAATELCNCIKTKSQDVCKKQLNDNYGRYANNSDFINAFNKAQDCGATIYTERSQELPKIVFATDSVGYKSN